MKQKFKKLGKVELSEQLNKDAKQNPETKAALKTCLARYMNHDWGNLTPLDQLLNDEALRMQERIVACYNDLAKPIYIITKSNRKNTYMLYVDEYKSMQDVLEEVPSKWLNH